MASFDFVDASAKGYEFLWNERGYLSRVAIPVLFVKVACILAVHLLGAEKQYMLSGLVMMPGFVLEAIFAIGLIRFVLYREPIMISGRAVPEPKDNAPIARYMGSMTAVQAVQAGFVMYLLIRVLQVALSSWMQDYNLLLEQQNFKPEPLEPNFLGMLFMLAMLWVIIWAFRLGWLFVPLAMGLSFVTFLQKIRGFSSSFYFFAAWFLCSLPLLVLYGVLANLVNMIFPDGSGANIVFDAIVLAGIETTMVALQVLAMTYGVTEIMSVGSKKPEKQYCVEMKIFVVDQSGEEHELEAVEGWRVMEIIREYQLPIKAECGGACACATCHVYVDADWFDKLPEMREDEEEMLDEAFDVQDNSRLSCQIIMDEDLDGLRVTLAPSDDQACLHAGRTALTAHKVQ